MNLPALHGNWIDLIIILLLIFYLIGGSGRGLILGFLDLGGFLFSFVSALKFYTLFGNILVDNFSIPRGISNALGFLFAGLFAEIILSFLINLSYNKFYPKIYMHLKKRRYLSFFLKLERSLGFIPVIGEALIFTAFILTLLVSLPIQGAIKKDIVSSKIGGPLVSRTSGIERQLNKIFGEAVNETLTFLTINPNPSSNDKVDLRFSQKDVKIDEAAEQTMLNLLNSERISHGLRHLSLSFQLRDLSRDYAKDMFARGYFSHFNPEGQSPFDRMEKKAIHFTARSEEHTSEL